jgi:hypothetical protein
MKKLETALVFADIMGALKKPSPRSKEDFE